MRKIILVIVWGILLGHDARSADDQPLPIYQPKITLGNIYWPQQGVKPLLKYNHDVDIVKFKNRFIAAWNANETPEEGVPGQYNFSSVSDDFVNWSSPVRLFTKDANAENPVESDNQWQPNFINYHDQTLFCAWCDFNARRMFIASSEDGHNWKNRDVAVAPEQLKGKVVGFPTNHGLLTKKDVLLFPCSLPVEEEKFIVGHTRYAGVLRSTDRGQTWTWSDPIEAVTWTQMGESPANFGGDTVYLWEPMLFEQPGGRIGLLIRNSTAQDNPERQEKSYRMLLYCYSDDEGKTWTKARSVDVDTICSRNFAVAGARHPSSLLMVMNDNHVGIPKRISFDRYFLSLYCSPTCDPDLLLPGPVVQPSGGTAFYPNGFVDKDKLYLAYSYGGMNTTVVDPCPDYSRPFLLPRGGRPGLKLESGVAHFEHPQSSLGLVLTEELSRKANLRLEFDLKVVRYSSSNWTLLTLGGRTHEGTAIWASYSEPKKSDVFQLRLAGNKHVDIAPFKLNEWNHFVVELGEKSCSVSVNGSAPQSIDSHIMRKICFGGLYVPPEWPQGMARNLDVQVKLDTIRVK